MDESQHRPKLQIALNARRTIVAALVTIVTLAAVLVLSSREQKSIEWIPYPADSVADNKSEGKSSAVIFHAQWALSADPKGGLVNPVICQSLANAGFVTTDADLTDSTVGSFQELKKQGFAAIPVLVLYPTAGPPVGFDGGTPESEIVSMVEWLSR